MAGIDATGLGQGTGPAQTDGLDLQHARTARAGVVPEKDRGRLRIDRLPEYHQGSPERLYPLLRAFPPATRRRAPVRDDLAERRPQPRHGRLPQLDLSRPIRGRKARVRHAVSVRVTQQRQGNQPVLYQ